MRGSPLRNFACVITLLAVMATGVTLTTRRDETAPPIQRDAAAPVGSLIKVRVRMTFSHQPEKVIIQQADKLENETVAQNQLPTNNELNFSLELPAEQVTEFLLDVTWPEHSQAHYFTQITIRQDSKEDHSMILSDFLTQLSDTFSIDTRNPSATKP